MFGGDQIWFNYNGTQPEGGKSALKSLEEMEEDRYTLMSTDREYLTNILYPQVVLR